MESVVHDLLEGHFSTQREGGGEGFLAEFGRKGGSRLLVQASFSRLRGIRCLSRRVSPPGFRVGGRGGLPRVASTRGRARSSSSSTRAELVACVGPSSRSSMRCDARHLEPTPISSGDTHGDSPDSAIAANVRL